MPRKCSTGYASLHEMHNHFCPEVYVVVFSLCNEVRQRKEVNVYNKYLETGGSEGVQK